MGESVIMTDEEKIKLCDELRMEDLNRLRKMQQDRIYSLTDELRAVRYELKTGKMFIVILGLALFVSVIL